VHNETLSVVAMCVRNPDRSPVGINRYDVAVEQTNHTHQKGNPYRCRIDVTISRGHELAADERQMDNGTHQPLNKVIALSRWPRPPAMSPMRLNREKSQEG
jgi:hypothetical protein